MRVLGTGAEVDAPREGTETDVLGVGAYDNGKLVGLAGCSADCEDMWQIEWMFCRNIEERELPLR